MTIKKIVIIAVALIVAVSISVPVVSTLAANNSLPRQLELGNTYLLEGKYEEAVLAFERAIRIDPKNIDAHMGLSKAYIGLDKLEEAKEPLYVVIDIEDTHTEAYLILSEVLEELDDIEEAYRVLDEGIQATHEPVLYLALADLKLRQGDLEEAMLILEEGIAQTGSEILQSRLDEIRPAAPIAVSNETDGYTLELKSSIAGWRVYYTTDGTDPVTNGISYHQAVNIEAGETTIKAVSVSDRGTVSDIFEYVYIVQPENIHRDPDQTDDEDIDTDSNQDTTLISNTPGNLSANINMGGYAAPYGDGAIYINNQGDIVKSNDDGSETATLIVGGNMNYVNVVGDWLYYVYFGAVERMKLDGSSEWEMIVEERVWNLLVAGDWVYYISSDNDDSLVKIRTDGTQRTQINDVKTVYFNVVDDWIYYLMIDSDNTAIYNYHLYRMHTDGSQPTEILDNCYSINITDDWIYFVRWREGSIYKMRTDGSEETLIFNEGSVHDIVVDGDWIYFIDWTQNFSLFKIRNDGTQLTRLNNDKTYSFNVANDWIFYVNDDDISMYKIRTDGTERTRLE